MLDISKPLSYKWPIEVRVPRDGTYDTVTFTATFRVMPEATRQELVQEQGSDLDVLRQTLIDWTGVSAEFSQESLQLMADNCPPAISAMVKAYFESLRGKEFLAKN